MFTSSNVYYDYRPVITNGSNNIGNVSNNNNNSVAMEVEDDSTKRQQTRFLEKQNIKRKRCLLKDDPVPGYMNGFKRSREDFAFRDGVDKRLFNRAGEEQRLPSPGAPATTTTESEHHGLFQMYHEPLLCLSPAAADFECRRISYHHSPAAMAMTGNLKLQPANSSNYSCSSKELEDMLLLTHGCSSYHHQATAAVGSSDGCYDEAEF
ncbi:uncharacterized protein LOC106640987 isoform X2 [Copidosoma floridanum]|uniref:uncharacterized protein LOC106640987 isoform X2 n=1 Tax=Copidosoma floridanum TaxID=29053 RepID=UPI0006C98104|nr:uncharacterized protein LOC106640987 isoform X2 [Copidosoma floridanum]